MHGGIYRSSLRFFLSKASWPAALCALALMPPGGLAFPGGLFDLARAVAGAQIIVGGVYLSDYHLPLASPSEPSRLARFRVERVIKGAIAPGEVLIDVSPPDVGVGFAGQPEIALLNRTGGRLVPATLQALRGIDSFLPADGRGFTGTLDPLAEVVREVGNLLTDQRAPLALRSIALGALRRVPGAKPYLAAEARDPTAQLRYPSIGFLIEGGDLSPLPGIAAELTGRGSIAPEADILVYAIAEIKSPLAIPALDRIEREAPPQFRLAAIKALGGTHSLAAIPGLRDALVRGNFEERYWAISGMQMIMPRKEEPLISREYFREHEEELDRFWLDRTMSAARPGHSG